MGRRKLHLLDWALVSITTYSMVVETPVGGLFLRAGAWAMGARVSRPFAGEFDVEGPESWTAPALALDEDRTELPLGLSPGLAPALASTLTPAGEGRRRRDEEMAAAFAEVGVTAPKLEDALEPRRRRILEGVSKLSARLGGEEAAVAALAAGFSDVAFAIERARLANAASPSSYEQLRPYLTPVRRHRADTLVRGTFALATAFDMRWPVDPSAPVSSKFGPRVHPVLGTSRFHAGTDLSVPPGTEVEAVAAGVVSFAGRDGLSGTFLKVDHGHGLTSIYCHLSQLEVTSGQRVARGARVARSGASGLVTGPHLHFQVEVDGRPIDPERFRAHAPRGPGTR